MWPYLRKNILRDYLMFRAVVNGKGFSPASKNFAISEPKRDKTRNLKVNITFQETFLQNRKYIIKDKLIIQFKFYLSRSLPMSKDPEPWYWGMPTHPIYEL